MSKKTKTEALKKRINKEKFSIWNEYAVKKDSKENQDFHGIYLALSCKGIKTFNDQEDKNGILYIGKSTGANRHRLVNTKDNKYDKWFNKEGNYSFDHSALTFIFDFDDQNTLRLFKTQQDIPKRDDQSTPKLVLIKIDQSSCEKQTLEEIEQYLIHGYMIKYGQSPTFNCSNASLKSLYNLSEAQWDRSLELFKYMEILLSE